MRSKQLYIKKMCIRDSDIPEKNKKCIDSWKKICPDYEILQCKDVYKRQAQCDSKMERLRF